MARTGGISAPRDAAHAQAEHLAACAIQSYMRALLVRKKGDIAAIRMAASLRLCRMHRFLQAPNKPPTYRLGQHLMASKIQRCVRRFLADCRILQRYRTMLHKLHVPEVGVRQAMLRNGVEERLMRKILPTSPKEERKTERRTFKVQWVFRQEAEAASASVHARVLANRSSATAPVFSQQAAACLETAFVWIAKSNPPSENAARSNHGSHKPGSTRGGLLNEKASLNLGILLQSSKLDVAGWKSALLALDITSTKESVLEGIMEHHWPSDQELLALARFHGDPSTLTDAERFFVEIRDIPTFKIKMQSILFRHRFHHYVKHLEDAVVLVVRGVNQLCDSQVFVNVLDYIHQAICFLHFGDAAREHMAKKVGFRVDALSRLAHTISVKGDMTFLQFVVRSMREDCPELLKLDDQIDLAPRWTPVNLDDLQSQFQYLKESFQQLQQDGDNTPSTFQDRELEPALQAYKTLVNQLAVEMEPVVREVQQHLKRLDEAIDKLRAYLLPHPIDTPFSVIGSDLKSFLQAFTEARDRLNFKHATP